MGVADAADRPVGEFSKGMARRIDLAQALLNEPDLMILDEPTSGLDPIGRHEVKTLIKELASEGRTVLLSSHLLAEVEDVCDRVVILGHFYLMIKGLPLEALKRSGYWCVGVLLARVVGFGLVLLCWPGAQDVLLGREIIWTAWRVCFGFFGPLTLIWMTRDALRYRHTQAATGILYVAIFFMLMGELAATWIEARTGFPV